MCESLSASMIHVTKRENLKYHACRCDVMAPRIALLFHGHVHLLKLQRTVQKSIILRSGIDLSLESLANAKTMDINPYNNPSFIVDLEQPFSAEMIDDFGSYDVISAEYPPFTVYKSPSLFDNILKILKPGGIFIMWPGFVDMRTRTKIAKDVLKSHPGFQRVTKRNKVLIFQRTTME